MVRSALFVPANSVEKRTKAFAAGADAVIVDLEDAVGLEAKASARAELGAGGPISADADGCLAFVRINSPMTEFGQADLEVADRFGADGIVTPKAEPEAIRVAATLDLPQIALIESASGVRHAFEIAEDPTVIGLLFGPIDLAAELGISEEHDGTELQFARSQVVFAAAAADKPIRLDGPCPAFRDEAAQTAENSRARRLGFTGKACIHPVQVAPVNAAFSASSGEVEWARRVVTSFEAADGDVSELDGKMIDRPVAARASQILSKAAHERDRI